MKRCVAKGLVKMMDDDDARREKKSERGENTNNNNNPNTVDEEKGQRARGAGGPKVEYVQRTKMSQAQKGNSLTHTVKSPALAIGPQDERDKVRGTGKKRKQAYFPSIRSKTHAPGAAHH